MSLTDLLSVPNSINPGLNGTTNALMLSLLGNPRSDYGTDCRPVTDATLKAKMVTKFVRTIPRDRLGSGSCILDRALSREHRLARAISKGMARLCSCSRVRPMPGGFSSEEAQYAAGDEVTLEVEGVVDGGMCGEEALR